MTESGKLLTLDQITAAKDVAERVAVEVPEWEGAVKVRGLTRGEVLRLQEFDGYSGDAWLIHTALIDPAVTLEQAAELVQSKGLMPVSRIIDAVLEASGIRAGFRPGDTDQVRP